MKLITTELNDQLLDFSSSLTKYVTQILLYITFKSEERPFPFSPWPASDEASGADSDDNTQAKTSKKKTSKKKTTKKESNDSEET